MAVMDPIGRDAPTSMPSGDGAVNGGGASHRPHARKGPAKTARANIRDIAAVAGVSVATVSRVMRGNARVSDETRAKVEKAVEELGYVPNAHALALTTPPNSVTLVMRSIGGGTYSDMAGAVADEAVGRGMTFRLIATGGARVDAKAVLTDLLAQRPRIAIVVADESAGAITDAELNEYVGRFSSMGTSLVALARPRMGLAASIGVVDYANERGTYELTRHLLSLGHRDILYVGARGSSSPVFHARYRGFLGALEEAGIRHDTSTDLPLNTDRDADVAAIVDRCRSGPSFTAVMGVTDVVALDAVNALHAQGVRVPDDVSVAGFDDMPYAGDLIVPLTTVHVSFADMGAASVRIGLDGTRDVMIPARVVVRASMGPASARG